MINISYEKALLGCVLFDNRVLENYKITQSFFTTDTNIAIWREIERAETRGAEANILEISLMLPDKAGYIAGLTDYVTHGNVKIYYDDLRECMKRRAFVDLLNGLSARIRDNNESKELAEYTEQTLTEISESNETGYKHVSECLPAFIKNIEDACARKGALSGIDTGFSGLNEKNNGWQKQTLNIIGARPGAGKTSIALNMASSALRTGHCVGFFSAEMDSKSIVKRMVSDWALVDFHRLNSGFFTAGDMEKITEACEEIAANKLFLNDRPAIRLGDLISEARKMKRKEKIDIIFIDYLSLVKNERRDIPRHEQIAEISKALKQTSRELDIPIVVLSQLTREAQGERPKLSQLRDSGAVEEDSDMVILLWNKGYKDETKNEVLIEFIVEKNRNGPIGNILMTFTPNRMRFKEDYFR
jgi:replicative DNA helicase